MIELSSAFDMVGAGGCTDVASSLVGQGTDLSMSIPIYEVFYLKILVGNESGFLSCSIQEYNALRKLAETCGSVTVTINLLDMDLLTLIGAILIYTPNTGPNIFIKLGDILNNPELPEDILRMLSDLAGIPIPEGVMGNATMQTRFALHVLQILFDRLVEVMQNDLESKGIHMHKWEELPEYFNMLQNSGEMARMAEIRQQLGGIVL